MSTVCSCKGFLAEACLVWLSYSQYYQINFSFVFKIDKIQWTRPATNPWFLKAIVKSNVYFKICRLQQTEKE